MKLAFMKIEKITETDKSKTIHIPAGGIQFEYNGQAIQSMEPVQIEISHEGIFKNILHNIKFAVYLDQSLFATGGVMHESLVSVVAHEDVQRAIYKEMAKRCKILPLFKKINEREVFAREFEYAYEQLLEVQ